EDRENRSVPAEPQRDGADHCEGKRRRTPEAAQSIAHVLQETLHHLSPALIAARFPRHIAPTELDAGLTCGLARSHADCEILAGLHFEVEAQFVFHLFFHLGAKEQGIDSQAQVVQVHGVESLHQSAADWCRMSTTIRKEPATC